MIKSFDWTKSISIYRCVDFYTSMNEAILKKWKNIIIKSHVGQKLDADG